MPTETPRTNRLGPWGWFTLVVLAALLVAAAVYAVRAWTSVHATVSPLGWLFLVLGVVVTILVGGGLMALVFYSSRHDYDQ
ncbi:MAG TPA: hypothetical protein VMH86_02580 [Rhizomicrobium sp.]|nr:hypothetical protein [Rhizomicrobium sp.]